MNGFPIPPISIFNMAADEVNLAGIGTGSSSIEANQLSHPLLGSPLFPIKNHAIIKKTKGDFL